MNADELSLTDILALRLCRAGKSITRTSIFGRALLARPELVTWTLGRPVLTALGSAKLSEVEAERGPAISREQKHHWGYWGP